MSNKTSDKNVANEKRLNNFIEAYKQTKEQSFIVDCINKDFFFEFVDCLLAELEKKDKRIQELEAKLLDMIQGTEIINKETPEYVKENYIPIQVVKDKIKEIKRLRDKCITTEGYNIANGEVVVLQELLEGERK